MMMTDGRDISLSFFDATSRGYFAHSAFRTAGVKWCWSGVSGSTETLPLLSWMSQHLKHRWRTITTQDTALKIFSLFLSFHYFTPTITMSKPASKGSNCMQRETDRTLNQAEWIAGLKKRKMGSSPVDPTQRRLDRFLSTSSPSSSPSPSPSSTFVKNEPMQVDSVVPATIKNPMLGTYRQQIILPKIAVADADRTVSRATYTCMQLALIHLVL